MAEHFSQIKDVANNEDGQIAAFQPASISAYTWYLLAEKTAGPMLEQIAEGKKNLARTMSSQQLAEAEGKAAAWLTNTKKQSGFAVGIDAQTGERKKKHASAR